MSPDPLATLLRIRRSNLDDAKLALVAALRQQQQMQMQNEAEESRFAEESVAALDLADGDEAVDAFARWLPIGRKAVERARLAEQEASGELDRARVVLGLASAAYRSVELLIEKRLEGERKGTERKLQQEMDEYARRPSMR